MCLFYGNKISSDCYSFVTWFDTDASSVILLFQDCFGYLKFVGLSTQPTFFLVAPSSWHHARIHQCPTGEEDHSQPLDGGWFEAAPSGNSLKNMQSNHPSGRTLKSWNTRWGAPTFHSWGRSYSWGVPSRLHGFCAGSGIYLRCVSIFPTHFRVGIFSFSLCAGVAQLVSGFLSEEIAPHVALHFMYLVKEGSPGASNVFISPLLLFL